MIFRVWTHETAERLPCSLRCWLAEAAGRWTLWMRPVRCFCAVGSSSTAALQPELQATVAMEATGVGACSLGAAFPGRAAPFLLYPSASFPGVASPRAIAIVRGVRELQRHQSGLQRREAPPPPTPPSGGAAPLLFIHFAHRHP